MNIQDAVLSYEEQKINWGVTLPRDPAAVAVESQWEEALGPRDPETGLRLSRLPMRRLTAEEGLEASRALSLQSKARKAARKRGE